LHDSVSVLTLLATCLLLLCFFYHSAAPEISTLSLHDALPIWGAALEAGKQAGSNWGSLLGRSVLSLVDAGAEGRVENGRIKQTRSEEHTSELQSRVDLVCRLLLEKKK